MEIFSTGLFRVSSGTGVKLNNSKSILHFGNISTQDSFQSSNVEKLFNEAVIKKLISQNPELKKILSENKIPLRLNMKELADLQQKHCKDTQIIASKIVANLPPALKSKVNMKDLKDGAILHDFGKVLIPPEILNKNGALTSSEHQIMDLHSELGYQ